jgi:hypothetical protein
LLVRPSVKSGFAFPRIWSSSPAGTVVSPFTHSGRALAQKNTCLPCSFTFRNFGPQKVPNGSPTMMRCDKRPDCPWPFTSPVPMNVRPKPRLVTSLRSTVPMSPTVRLRFVASKMRESSENSTPVFFRSPTFSRRVDTTAGCGTATSRIRSFVFF